MGWVDGVPLYNGIGAVVGKLQGYFYR